MTLFQIKSWIIPGFVLAIVLVNLPNIPIVINVVGTFSLGVLAFISYWLIFQYYNSLPAPKQTVLVSLMQFLMITNGIVILQAIFIVLPAKLFPGIVQELFDIAPNLTCSVLSNGPQIILVSYCMFAILLFKAMAVVMPEQYLSMNHHRISKISLAAITIVTVMEYAIFFSFYRTLCTKWNIYYFSAFLRLKLDKDLIRSKPPTLIVHLAVVLLPRLVAYFGRLWKKKFPRRLKIKKNKVSTICPIVEQDEFENHEQDRYPNLTSETQDIDRATIKIGRTERYYEGDIQIINIEEDEVLQGIDEILYELEGNDSGSGIPNKKLIKECDDTTEASIGIDNIELEFVSTSDTCSQNLVPRPNYTENLNIYPAKDETDQNKKISQKPKLLKTELAVILITIGLIFAIYSALKNDQNYTVIWFHTIVGRIFFLVLPHYWILRSEEKSAFLRRRVNRLLKRY
jgi:hypothetical protein